MAKNRFEPTEMVEAADSFSARVGDAVLGVARGTRLRANHPVVKAMPYLFAPAGTPEVEELRRKLYGEVIEATRAGNRANRVPVQTDRVSEQ